MDEDKEVLRSSMSCEHSMIAHYASMGNPGAEHKDFIKIARSCLFIPTGNQWFAPSPLWPFQIGAPPLADNGLAHQPADCSLTRLAEECRLSVRQLSRAFQISRGCSNGAYVAKARIAYAQGRLTQGVPIAMVAKETGFSTTSNFTAPIAA